MPYTELIIATGLLALTGLWAGFTGRRMERAGKHPHRPQNGLPLLEAAYLAGGPVRVADAVIARMEQEGRLIVPRTGQATLTDRTSHEPAEADLIRVVGPTGRAHLATMRQAVLRSPQVRRIGRRLADRGLLYQPRRQRRALRANRLLLIALGLGTALGVLAGVRRLLTPGGSLLPALGFVLLLPLGLLWQRLTAPARSRITPAGMEQLEHLRKGVGWDPHGRPRAARTPARPSTAPLGSAPNSGIQLGVALAELVLYGTLAHDPDTDGSDGSGGSGTSDGPDWSAWSDWSDSGAADGGSSSDFGGSSSDSSDGGSSCGGGGGGGGD
ncbi:TIGR04222 domain-containing membrane protein [Kitasatospora sp. NPDC002040]|uniref:TIGR04222 domain-containing membrane protein n=1 Tax=Kitasatospora sp. NPDC002040 TaxID=3154661 RepID=UPI00332D0D0B